jgi:Flp pilus assembly protein TadG
MKRFSFRRFGRDTAGTTAVEFAILMTPLLLLIFGAVEFSRLMWAREALQSTATAGARCMGVKQTSCAPSGSYDAAATKTFVTTWGQGLYIAIPAANITLSNSATCSGSSGFSSVTITYTFNSVIAGLLEAIDTVDLSASACFPNQLS